jgi:hypothetical protein
LSAGYGERFFGETPRAEFSHRRKRSLFVITYSRNVTFNRNIRGEGAQTIEEGEGGGIDVGDDPFGFGGQTTLSRGPLVNERFAIGFRLQGRRNTLSIDGTRSEQKTSDAFNDSIFTNASVALNRRLGRKLSANARIGWNKSESGEDSQVLRAGDSEAWTGSLGISRNIGPSTSLQVNYRYTSRDSDVQGDDVTENRVTFTLNTNF